jgi:hypothetical protein
MAGDDVGHGGAELVAEPRDFEVSLEHRFEAGLGDVGCMRY